MLSFWGAADEHARAFCFMNTVIFSIVPIWYAMQEKRFMGGKNMTRRKWILAVLLLLVVSVGIGLWQYVTMDVTVDEDVLACIDFSVLAEHTDELKQNGFIFNETSSDTSFDFHTGTEEKKNDCVIIAVWIGASDKEPGAPVVVRKSIFKNDGGMIDPGKRYNGWVTIKKYDNGCWGKIDIWVYADSKRECSRLVNKRLHALFTNYTWEIEE